MLITIITIISIMTTSRIQPQKYQMRIEPILAERSRTLGVRLIRRQICSWINNAEIIGRIRINYIMCLHRNFCLEGIFGTMDRAALWHTRSSCVDPVSRTNQTILFLIAKLISDLLRRIKVLKRYIGRFFAEIQRDIGRMEYKHLNITLIVIC